jgi:hypothetical protein
VGPLLFIVLCLGGAGTLIAAAGWIFASADPQGFWRKFAELLLQLALIVVVGAVVKLLVDLYLQRRSGAELDDVKRRELLHRLRAQHVTVSYAQRLIVAHRSGGTYTEQLRELIRATSELEDIAEDVRVAEVLFGTANAEIVAGIAAIVGYLNRAADEYVRCHEFVDEDARAGRPVTVTMAEHNMTWLDDFIESFPEFPEAYAGALDRSKGNMRKVIYGQ